MGTNQPYLEHKVKALKLETGASCTSNIFGNSAENCYSCLTSAPKDSEAQKQLQQERLKYVLNQLQREREATSFSRNCLFCSKHFTGNRTVLLEHLVSQHNFSIGAPDNIVFIEEYLDHLETLLKNLQCFYCEKLFRDLPTLKEHMRKKQHKRINPQNKQFDRFYVINYLEFGKTWVDIEEEEDGRCPEGNESEFMDWDGDANVYTCLFCENKLADFDETLRHVKDEHQFDFRHLQRDYKLDFYKQIKLINYIRKKVYDKECTVCDSQFIVHEDLLEHMTESRHIEQMPDPSRWDQPLYFFPTFENDTLLCGLDAEDEDTEGQNYVVLPEEDVPST